MRGTRNWTSVNIQDLSYGCPSTIPETILETIHTYLIFKPNHLTSFLITTSLLSLTHQHGYEKTLICLFMCVKFISIQIKLEIDVNNDELLKTIWEHTRKKIVNCHW